MRVAQTATAAWVAERQKGYRYIGILLGILAVTDLAVGEKFLAAECYPTASYAFGTQTTLRFSGLPLQFSSAIAVKFPVALSALPHLPIDRLLKDARMARPRHPRLQAACLA